MASIIIPGSNNKPNKKIHVLINYYEVMAWGWSLDAAQDLRTERNEKEGAKTANRVDKSRELAQKGGRLGAWVSFRFRGLSSFNFGKVMSDPC